MNIGNRASQHNFAVIPSADIPRSSFNRSFQRKQTFNADYLVPIYLDEIVPGDTFNLSLTSFARLATPIVPFMDNLHMDYFFFFVPNRLVWDSWQKFMGEQINPGDSTDFTIPLHAAASLTVAENTLQNYMGLSKATYNMTYTPVSALPFRMYNLIWNEWFRDENLQSSITVNKDNGPDTPANYVLKKRGKRHDYFTSALPWPQKGPSVSLPLGTTAPVYPANTTTGSFSSWVTSTSQPIFTNNNYSSVRLYSNTGANDSNARTTQGFPTTTWGTTGSEPLLLRRQGTVGIDANPTAGLFTDLTAATAATINQLREAFQVQRLYERDARGGTRYIEIIRSHFGVQSPDFRLQRPEYLGGGTAAINISPVPQTSSTDAETPQGNLAAFGTQIARNIGFQKSFVEHGYVIGMAAARADLSYQQGIEKSWMRRTRFDFYFPTFAHLGEQTIRNGEIYVQNTSADALPFGYQERYAEMRYKPSQILGTFASNATGTLDIWHLAQNFGSLPALNASFIESSTPISRVIAVPTEPQFLWDGFFNLICARPMPTYSVPGYIDHF